MHVISKIIVLMYVLPHVSWDVGVSIVVRDDVKYRRAHI